MNKFKERLKVEKVKEENDFREKVNFAVIQAILDIETSSKSEEMQKLEYIINLRKIMDNYEQLRPILTEYFKDEKWKDR